MTKEIYTSASRNIISLRRFFVRGGKTSIKSASLSTSSTFSSFHSFCSSCLIRCPGTSCLHAYGVIPQTTVKPCVFRLQLPPRPRHYGTLEQVRPFETMEAVRRLFQVCTIMTFCGFSKRNKQVMNAQIALRCVSRSGGITCLAICEHQNVVDLLNKDNSSTLLSQKYFGPFTDSQSRHIQTL